MTTGRSIYNDLTSNVSKVQQEVNSLSSKVHSIESNIDDLMNSREDILSNLAKFYLPELNANTINTTIREKQSTVQAIFKAKQERRVALETEIASAYKRKEDACSNLNVINEKLDKAKVQRAELGNTYNNLLANDTEYQGLLIKAHDMNERIKLNTTRLEEVTQESKQKISEFTANNLFNYLLNKNFGTTEYNSSGLIKKLDIWVAKVVKYDVNKQNYDILKSMPELMSVELERRTDVFNQITSKGKEIEKKYSDKVGLTQVMNLGRDLAAQKTEILNNVDTYTNLHKQYLQERQSLENTKDSYHVKAIQELKSFLKSDSIVDLKRIAQETPSPEDDRLVYKMETIDASIRSYKDSAKKIKEELDSKSEKLNELESLVNQFRREDYDDSDSRFRSGLDLDNLMTGYLLGRLSSKDVWNDLSSHQYVESPAPSYSHSPSYNSPTFGGGGFGGGGGFSSGGGF